MAWQSGWAGWEQHEQQHEGAPYCFFDQRPCWFRPLGHAAAIAEAPPLSWLPPPLAGYQPSPEEAPAPHVRENFTHTSGHVVPAVEVRFKGVGEGACDELAKEHARCEQNSNSRAHEFRRQVRLTKCMAEHITAIYAAHGHASQHVEQLREERFATQPLHRDQLRGRCSHEPVEFQELHYVVVWNVAPSTTPRTLADELYEVDFTPKELAPLGSCEDAFLLVFEEAMDARCACIALDKTSIRVRDNGSGVIRLVKIYGPEHDQIPAAISASAQAFISRRPARDKQGRWHVAV